MTYTENQRKFLATALEFDNWSYDDEPNTFNHPRDGKVVWLKSTGYTRIRISKYDARFYRSADGTRFSEGFRLTSNLNRFRVRLENMRHSLESSQSTRAKQKC